MTQYMGKSWYIQDLVLFKASVIHWGGGLGMCSMWSKGNYCINHTFLLYSLNFLLIAENTETIFSCGIKNKQQQT